MKNILTATLLLLTITSCTLHSPEENELYVTSEQINITQNKINTIITQELYENIYNIYNLRKEAIEREIKLELIKKGYKDDLNLPFEKILSKHQIEILLEEPTPPYINFRNPFKNVSKDKITIGIFINPECDLCHFTSKRIEILCQRFSNLIEIEYIPYSINNDLPNQALIFAMKYRKANLLYSSLLPQVNDTLSILKKMASLKLDTISFKSELHNIQKEALSLNFHIQECGINKTPTVLISNHLIANPLDTTSIKKQIQKELDKLKKRANP